MKDESIEKKVKEMNENYLRSVEDNSDGVKESIIKALLTAIAIMLGVLIWVMCAEKQAEAFEVQAAVVKMNHLTATWMVGAEVVGPIPESQAEEVLPDAIDGVQKMTLPEAKKVEAVGEPHEEWVSLGVWKLSAYCPLDCCNGKGRAWKTSSGKPMKVGWTVATYDLPEGTEVMINGHIYGVEDVGVRGNRIDVLYPDHESANDFGIRYAEVFVKR